MPVAFAAAETIAASPARVWAVLIDFEQAHRWMGEVTFVDASGPIEAGTELRFETRGKTITTQVVGYEAERSLVLRSTQGPVTAEYAYALVPEGDGTRVTLEATCEARGFAALFAPFIRGAIRKTDGGQITALKAVVES